MNTGTWTAPELELPGQGSSEASGVDDAEPALTDADLFDRILRFGVCEHLRGVDVISRHHNLFR